MKKDENKMIPSKNIMEEIETRIEIMERDDYEYPPLLNHVDWLGAVILTLLCLACVLYLMYFCSAL